MNFPRKWIRISFLNLFIVSFVGIVLRYKIIFPLPFIDQKFLLHAHSHFAFSGWLTQILMAFIIQYILNENENTGQRKYQILLWINLISAYGMLLSFPFQGYGAVSISFSTLSVFNSYVFAFIAWKDLNKLPLKNISHIWFKASFIFNAISSFGAFALGYMMANKIIQQDWYLAAVYFFLHFQYNGWFFFAAMGLFIQYLANKNIPLPSGISWKIFLLFFLAAIPAYFFSALWLPIPLWIYIIVAGAAFSQLMGYYLLLKHIILNRKNIKNLVPDIAKWLWILSCTALGIKLLLQAGSTIPSLNVIAYGFRPIVIGYLHLVLLGVLTIFILGYYFATQEILFSRQHKTGAVIFVFGIIINEILLMLQGVTDMSGIYIKSINILLFATALIMFAGLFLLNKALMKND